MPIVGHSKLNYQSSSFHSNNAIGTNQHSDCCTDDHFPLLTCLSHVFIAMPDNENVNNLLKQYHHDGITNKKNISGLLRKKGYTMRWCQLFYSKSSGLILSHNCVSIVRQLWHATKQNWAWKVVEFTMEMLLETAKRQMLLKQMVKDPTKKQGPHAMKENIAHDEGMHPTW